MINSQQKQDISLKKITDEIINIKNALFKVKDAEVKLHEIKYRLESLSNVFQENEQRKLKILKSSSTVLQSYKDLETIILEQIFPLIRNSKTRVDPLLYRNYQRRESLINSIRGFKDEFSTLLKDPTYLQNYKSFQEVFRQPEKGLIEFPYEFLIGVLEFLAIKERLLMIRFEKSFDFHELPETFFICFVRLDLITITLSFRKISSTFSKITGQKNEAETNENDKTKGEGNKVALYNIVYSNLFDQGLEKINLNSKKESLYIHWKCVPTDDEDIKNVVRIVKENQTKINLPCIYPGMTVFQRFSFYVTEKIEKYYKIQHVEINTKTDRLEGILTNILKGNSEEFTESVAGKCFICKRKFAMDSKSQKMLPPLSLSMRADRKEKVGPVHIGCRKLFENIEGDEPQIVVKVDCSDESDLFLQNFV